MDHIFHKIFVLNNNIILGRFTSLPRFSDKILRKLELYESFEGCIQYLQLNNKVFNITFPSNDIVNGLNIVDCKENQCVNEKCSYNGRCRLNNFSHECVCKKEYLGKWCQLKKNGCLNSPCKNSNSSCVPTSTGSFHCICPDDFEGMYCEKSILLSCIIKKLYWHFIIKFFTDIEIKAHFIASFNGNSYIERSGLQFLDWIDIIFMANNSNGVILYNYDFNNDNYLGIKIKNSYIVFDIKINEKFDRLM